jgi:hypothetical protein
MHQVNRDRKLPIRFRVNVREPIWKIAGSPPPSFWARQDGFDPDTALTAVEIAELDLSAFLSQVLLTSEGVPFTVNGVIRRMSSEVYMQAPNESRRSMRWQPSRRRSESGDWTR